MGAAAHIGAWRRNEVWILGVAWGQEGKRTQLGLPVRGQMELQPHGGLSKWGWEGRGPEPHDLILRVGTLSHAEPREAATSHLGHKALAQGVRK